MASAAKKTTKPAADEPDIDGDEQESPAVADERDSALVCMVNDERCVGDAGGINGVVCSAHAMEYQQDGTPRT